MVCGMRGVNTAKIYSNEAKEESTIQAGDYMERGVILYTPGWFSLPTFQSPHHAPDAFPQPKVEDGMSSRWRNVCSSAEEQKG